MTGKYVSSTLPTSSRHLLIRLFQHTATASIEGCRGRHFPKTLREFQAKFATEEACQQYLAACRWPDGFVCPRCGHRRAYELPSRKSWQCVAVGTKFL